jgi:hypothetical protein
MSLIVGIEVYLEDNKIIILDCEYFIQIAKEMR